MRMVMRMVMSIGDEDEDEGPVKVASSRAPQTWRYLCTYLRQASTE